MAAATVSRHRNRNTSLRLPWPTQQPSQGAWWSRLSTQRSQAWQWKQRAGGTMRHLVHTWSQWPLQRAGWERAAVQQSFLTYPGSLEVAWSRAPSPADASTTAAHAATAREVEGTACDGRSTSEGGTTTSRMKSATMRTIMPHTATESHSCMEWIKLPSVDRSESTGPSAFSYRDKNSSSRTWLRSLARSLADPPVVLNKLSIGRPPCLRSMDATDWFPFIHAQ
mmetsp:Transcript_31451/g.43649  ORF Transcript_31451/g.43649 Transcript_31451/m.43649 type:complete len:224 (-) Transcript_31451:283-954(-)